MFFTMHSVGIVIQGPLTYAQKIAVCYSKFRNVVISTWDDESPVMISHFKKRGYQVLLSKKPLNTGHWNINLQCESVVRGMKFFESNPEIKYIIKIRSDILLTNLDELIRRMENGKIEIATCGYSFNCSYNEFHIHDFIVLGTVPAMKKFWTHEHLDTNGQPYPERWLQNKYLGLPENFSFRNRWSFKKKLTTTGWILPNFKWEVDFLKHSKYNRYFDKTPVVIIPDFKYWLEVQMRTVYKMIFKNHLLKKAYP
jgi:hypothetical protein